MPVGRVEVSNNENEIQLCAQFTERLGQTEQMQGRRIDMYNRMMLKGMFCMLTLTMQGVFSYCAHAQDNAINFQYITVQHGLPSNTINGVVRDCRGFMWMASENGVCRYDGYTFTTFRARENDSLAISSNITYVIFEDRRKRLWVGCEKGLDLFNRELDRFDKHYFKGMPVRTIYQDGHNNIWAGTDSGLFLYDEIGDQFTKPFPQIFNSDNIRYNTVTSLTEDSVANLWIGTATDGIYVYNRIEQNFVHYHYQDGVAGSLNCNTVRKLIRDRRGTIWVATYGGGVSRFNARSRSFTAYTTTSRTGHRIDSDLVPVLAEDEAGRIWIGTDGAGLNILDPQTNVVQHVLHEPFNSRSLNNNVIRAISNDGKGGMWLGTYAGGINFFNRNAGAFLHYRPPTFNGNSSVTAFAEEDNGNLWIGTDGGGLCYYNRQTGAFTNFSFQPNDAASLSDNRVLSLLLDHQGVLWIGTYRGGLCRYSRRTGKFIRYRAGDRSNLSDDVVWTLLEDSRQRMWVGTNNGLDIYDAATDAFKRIDNTNSNISNNAIRALYEDRRKRIWVGTQEGLNVLHGIGHTFTVIRNVPGNPRSLSNNWIRTIHEDHAGNIWIGTLEGGLNVLNGGNTALVAFSFYKEADGLPDNTISGILNDTRNTLWISTGRGLAWLDLKTRKIRSYHAKDGLKDNQFNINACYQTRRGEFLFGGFNGFTLFTPDRVGQETGNPFPPPVAMTAFKIFNREVVPGAGQASLSRHINETDRISLAHDQLVLTFEFSALNFIRPENNQYAYRLQGFEDEWNYVGNQRSATYTNLAPGVYTFQVKASNNAGVWNEKGVSLLLEIRPPFWKTWWFRSVMALLAGLLVLLAFNLVRNRVREKIRINRLIAELEIKALITQMNPHFVFNCLTSIQELITMNKTDDAMHYLNQFARLLRTVLKSSEKNFVSLEQERIILESYLELEAMRFDRLFRYRIVIEETIDPEETLIPSFLIQPFVENALWHGLMGKKGDRDLTIMFSAEADDIIVCQISDNGVGREQAAAAKKKNANAHASMGIRIIRERIKLMKAQNNAVNLQILDNVDIEGHPAGTTVIIHLPVVGRPMAVEKSLAYRP